MHEMLEAGALHIYIYVCLKLCVHLVITLRRNLVLELTGIYVIDLPYNRIFFILACAPHLTFTCTIMNFQEVE